MFKNIEYFMIQCQSIIYLSIYSATRQKVNKTHHTNKQCNHATDETDDRSDERAARLDDKVHGSDDEKGVTKTILQMSQHPGKMHIVQEKNRKQSQKNAESLKRQRQMPHKMEVRERKGDTKIFPT